MRAASAAGLAALLTTVGVGFERYLPSVGCPVLVLQGSDDEYGTPDQVRAIEEGVAGSARSHLIPGVGHTPHRAAADQVLRLTIEFLDQTVPALARGRTDPSEADASSDTG